LLEIGFVANKIEDRAPGLMRENAVLPTRRVPRETEVTQEAHVAERPRYALCR